MCSEVEHVACVLKEVMDLKIVLMVPCICLTAHARYIETSLACGSDFFL